MKILVAFGIGLVIGAYPESAYAIGLDIIELVKATYDYLTNTTA